MSNNSESDSQLSQVNNLINVQIPSWNQLFGQGSQCEINECESITGAPHYLASLLYFLEHSGRNENLVNTDPDDPTKKTGETPYDILIKRVPYLPFLPLTCENTNIQLPYIQVVLEILEFYAASKTLVDMPAYDSGNDNWEENYKATATQAYQILSSACYPFNLPYNQPLDVIRSYLSKMKTSYSELLEKFGAPENNNQLRLIKEFLSFSDEEYSLLTQFKIGDKQFEACNLYGFNSSADFQKIIFNVSEFLQRTGLEYAELLNILKSKFVNQGNYAVDFIEKLFSNSGLDRKSLFSQLKAIRNSPLDNTFNTGLSTTIKNLLQHSVNPGLDTRSFKNWLDSNFDDFQQSIIIIPKNDLNNPEYDPCNYFESRLGTILSNNDPSIVAAISDVIFKKLYFFIRLLRKTGLQIDELDNILAPLSSKTNDEILITFYSVRKLMQKFKLSAGQVNCIYSKMNTAGTSSLYAKLFLNSSLNPINVDFKPDSFGNYFTKQVPYKTGDQYNVIFLSAMHLLPGQIDILFKYFGIDDPTKFNVSIESLSVIYSYVLMAQQLNLQMDELISLIGVFGKPGVLSVWDKNNNKFKDADLSDLNSFIEFTEHIKTSGFGIKELLFVLANNSDAGSLSQITDDTIREMLIALQPELERIDLQNPDPKKGASVDANFLKNELLLLYDKETSMQLTGMFNGNIIYGITIPPLPDSKIPDNLSNRITYYKDTGRLEVKGVLSLSDWNALNINPSLKNALQPIFAKPLDFLKNNFSQFIISDDDRNKLLDRNIIPAEPLTLKEKLITLSTLYYPYLVKKLKCKLIIKEIASLISLEERLTEIVIQPVIDVLYQSITKIVAEILTTSDYFPQNEALDLKNGIISLCRSSLFISRFGLNVEEVAYFINSSKDFSNIDFIDFNLEQWLRINNYSFLKKSCRSSQYSFIDLFTQASTAGSSIQSIVSSIVFLTGWEQEDVNGIINTYGYKLNDFINEQTLCGMNIMMQMVKKTGVKATQLSIWAKSDTQFTALVSLKSLIENSLLNQYNGNESNVNEATINGSILENQRDALVSYILTLDEIKDAGILEVESLCGWFLIDVPMNSCMPTTRVRQAISTVQSFVKRCLMGLESIKNTAGLEIGVLPKYIDDNIWEPISLFRTWQVKMEFLSNPYPYLSYKYIIEKSEAAKKFEETLLKSDITERTVEDAYWEYLKDLNETSRLEIASMYIDDLDSDKKASTIKIHVIGRSRSAPHNYFYCTKDEEDKWSFWEKISVPIKDNDSDDNSPSRAHTIFAKLKGRYYLILPEFIKRQIKNEANDQISLDDLASLPQTIIQSNEYWEIKIAVSEYYNGKWGSKKYLMTNGDTKPSLFQRNVIEKDVSKYFFVQDTSDPDKLVLSLRCIINQEVIEGMKFIFISPNSAIVITQGNGKLGNQDTGISYQNFKLSGPMTFPVANDETPPVILASQGEKLINFSPQLAGDLSSVYSHPFFLHDTDRSYYVTSQPINYIVQKTVTHFEIVTPVIMEPSILIGAVRNPEEVHFMAFHLLNTPNV